jgi:hypothetical protein
MQDRDVQGLEHSRLTRGPAAKAGPFPNAATPPPPPQSPLRCRMAALDIGQAGRAPVNEEQARRLARHQQHLILILAAAAAAATTAAPAATTAAGSAVRCVPCPAPATTAAATWAFVGAAATTAAAAAGTAATACPDAGRGQPAPRDPSDCGLLLVALLRTPRGSALQRRQLESGVNRLEAAAAPQERDAPPTGLHHCCCGAAG